MVRSSIAPKDSRTPRPSVATDSKLGAPRAFKPRSMILWSVMSGRSALVVLEHHRDRGGLDAVVEEILRHLLHALQILLPAIGRRVRDEDDAVRVLQEHLARRSVELLAGHGDHLEAQFVASERGGRERKQIEEDGAVLGGIDRDQLLAAIGPGVPVQHLEARGFSSCRRTVVENLDSEEALLVIDLDQYQPRSRSTGLPRMLS